MQPAGHERITCEWHGCGQSPDHDGLCERHARRDAGLRCDGGHESDERSVSLSGVGLLEEALTQIDDDDALFHIRSALQHLKDDAVEHETDDDALFHGEIEAHLRGERLRLLWKDPDAHEMLALLSKFVNGSGTDALAWWGDPPIGSDRAVGQWMNIDISEMGEQTDEQIETDGGMHVRHRRIHIREQGNDTDYPNGVGVELPSGTVVVEWVPEAWPPEERLDGAHQSHYASLADLDQVVSGSIYYLDGEQDEQIETDGGTVVESAETTETSKVWDGPFVERDKFGEPTGYRYVRCRSCGCEVIEHEREHVTHRDGCEHAVDRGDGVETDGGVEVPKQTERCDFNRAKVQNSTSWERAVKEEHDIRPTQSLGHYRVRLGDGDVHRAFLTRLDTGELAGRCDCDGWAFHRQPDDDQTTISGDTNDRSHPCAHLCALRQDEALGPVEIPAIPAEEVVGMDVDVIDHAPDAETDDSKQTEETRPAVGDNTVETAADGAGNPAAYPDSDSAEEPDLGGGDMTQSPAPAETRTVETTTPDEESVESHQEFVEQIAGVPSVFVVQMGRGESAKPYVTKEGLTFIARKMGIETRAEPLSPSWEDDSDVAAYRGVAVDDDGREYHDVATAHAGQVESTVGRQNLDELASTRATNRALRLATGCGYATVEEVDSAAAITPETADGGAD